MKSIIQRTAKTTGRIKTDVRKKERANYFFFFIKFYLNNELRLDGSSLDFAKTSRIIMLSKERFYLLVTKVILLCIMK